MLRPGDIYYGDLNRRYLTVFDHDVLIFQQDAVLYIDNIDDVENDGPLLDVRELTRHTPNHDRVLL